MMENVNNHMAMKQSNDSCELLQAQHQTPKHTPVLPKVMLHQLRLIVFVFSVFYVLHSGLLIHWCHRLPAFPAPIILTQSGLLGVAFIVTLSTTNNVTRPTMTGLNVLFPDSETTDSVWLHSTMDPRRFVVYSVLMTTLLPA